MGKRSSDRVIGGHSNFLYTGTPPTSGLTAVTFTDAYSNEITEISTGGNICTGLYLKAVGAEVRAQLQFRVHPDADWVSLTALTASADTTETVVYDYETDKMGLADQCRVLWEADAGVSASCMIGFVSK